MSLASERWEAAQGAATALERAWIALDDLAKLQCPSAGEAKALVECAQERVEGACSAAHIAYLREREGRA